MSEVNPVIASAVVAVALVVIPPVWGSSRHVVTLVHEAGHALIAVLTGRRLNAITLHSDTSGLTISSGRPTGTGMIATAAAGYLAPSALGLAGLMLVDADRTPWALWGFLVALAAILLFIRNGWGLVVVGLSGVAVAALTWRGSVEVQNFFALTFAWFLLVAGPRTVIDLWAHRRRVRSRTSDVDILARLTHVPAAVWNAAMLLLTVGALVLAARLVGWTGVHP